MITIRKATSDDATVLVPLLVEAFAQGPVAEWLVPAPGERRWVYHDYFADVFQREVEAGKVDTTADRSAVAVWSFRVGRQVIPRGRERVLQQVTGPYAGRFLRLERALADRHPTDPHHYLAFLAVAPQERGKGIGSALLTAYHKQHVDPRGLSVYLEATSSGNQRLYRRHRYVDGPELVLPGGPALYPMWRGHHLPTDWPKALRATPSAG